MEISKPGLFFPPKQQVVKDGLSRPLWEENDEGHGPRVSHWFGFPLKTHSETRI